VLKIKQNVLLFNNQYTFKEAVMAEIDRGDLFVRVKDGSGEEFVCPLKALRNPKDLTQEELEQCVDSATVGRYAGDIKIKAEK
jgi:hypothetical protein